MNAPQTQFKVCLLGHLLYASKTTEARLEYLDSLIKGEEPSSSTFLWDLIESSQSTKVTTRALDVALAIASTRERLEELAKALSRAFKAPAKDMRRHAFTLVETYPEPLIVPTLGEIVDSECDEAPLGLVALARIGNWQARDKLIDVAKNEKRQKELRVRAIILLGGTKDTLAKPALKELAHSDDADIQKAANQALSQLEK